ncbi:MAG TPA: metallophosphoesterase family protein [Anaerolineales bacterium]|nr:metallophosphoesterase family protein [Anaerolineales bacterium]HNC08961.1 metallophosphoesterase family protein [Anaerolineales bacterium]
MRIGFISDIHGNFTALEAVLADIKDQKIDQLVCLGDTVSLGPQPVEVLNTLREWKTINLMGNHDLAILDPEHAADYEITEHLIPDLYWGREKLSPEDFDFLRSYTLTHNIHLSNDIDILAFHGSPLSTTHLIQATTEPEKLNTYFADRLETVFIGGHSHIQMHRRYGKKLILNSGSVGNAFVYAYTPGNPPKLLPWAEYAILEQSGNFLNVDMRRVYFDTDAVVRRAKESDLPGAEWWIKQYQEIK